MREFARGRLGFSSLACGGGAARQVRVEGGARDQHEPGGRGHRQSADRADVTGMVPIYVQTETARSALDFAPEEAEEITGDSDGRGEGARSPGGKGGALRQGAGMYSFFGCTARTPACTARMQAG